MDKGIVIVAQNNTTTDYVACARVLAKSIKKTNPNLSVSIITNNINEADNPIFDYIIPLPHGDTSTEEWKLSNDWQVYEASPYDETIKIESDVLVTRDISDWWEICGSRELVIAQGCVDYKNRQSNSRFYRNFFDKNELPDVYNGIVYFKKTYLVQKFFMLIKDIYDNWEQYKDALAYCASSETPTNDIAYAIATNIIGEKNALLPKSINPLKWVHMKPRIINVMSDDWTRECFFEILKCGQVRINSYTQYYPIHYVHKELAKKFEKYYDND